MKLLKFQIELDDAAMAAIDTQVKGPAMRVRTEDPQTGVITESPRFASVKDWLADAVVGRVRPFAANSTTAKAIQAEIAQKQQELAVATSPTVTVTEDEA